MPLTKREAAIVGAYTGFLLGDFDDLHLYVQELMERPVFTHELGSRAVADEIQRLSKKDFVALEVR